MSELVTLVPVMVALSGAVVALPERNTRLILRRLDEHDARFDSVNERIDALYRRTG